MKVLAGPCLGLIAGLAVGSACVVVPKRNEHSGDAGRSNQKIKDASANLVAITSNSLQLVDRVVDAIGDAAKIDRTSESPYALLKSVIAETGEGTVERSGDNFVYRTESKRFRFDVDPDRPLYFAIRGRMIEEKPMPDLFQLEIFHANSLIESLDLLKRVTNQSDTFVFDFAVADALLRRLADKLPAAKDAKMAGQLSVSFNPNESKISSPQLDLIAGGTHYSLSNLDVVGASGTTKLKSLSFVVHLQYTSPLGPMNLDVPVSTNNISADGIAAAIGEQIAKNSSRSISGKKDGSLPENRSQDLQRFDNPLRASAVSKAGF